MRIAMISTINGKNDEGMKNIASNVFAYLTETEQNVQNFSTHSLFSIQTINVIKKNDLILIFLRGNAKTSIFMRLLKTKTNKIYFFAVQRMTRIFNLLTPKNVIDCVFYLDKKSIGKKFEKNKQFCISVDKNKFSLIDCEKTIGCLHVGHLTKGRKVLDILEVPSKTKTIIASNDFDNHIVKQLVDSGVNLITDYIDSIEKYYSSSFVYLFPTINRDYVIDVPISVLEAASCGVPILINEEFEGMELLCNYVQKDALFLYKKSTIMEAFASALKFSKNTTRHSFLLNQESKNLGELILEEYYEK